MPETANRFWRGLWQAEYGIAAIGGGFCLLSIMVITVLSVFGRYVLHADLIPGAYNLIERVLFPLMVFWALPLSHRDGMFPRLDLVMADRMTERQRAVIALFVGMVELLVYAALMYFVWLFVSKAIESHRTMMVGLRIWPLWPVAVMMPLSFALMMLEMLRLIWRDIHIILTGHTTAREPDLPHGSDVL